MSKVSVTKEKLDTLAEAVGTKSGENLPLTIDQMTSAVLGIELVNNQNKTITPTKSQQSIVADSGYTGLGTVTVNAIPAAYITTSDADATAADISAGKTAYVNGVKLTGTNSGGGGIDAPTFTAIWDDNWGSILSISCNKTFAECYALYTNGDVLTIGIDKTQSGSEEYMYPLTLSSGGGLSDNLTYTCYDVNGAFFDFVYNPNGTITYVKPSDFSEGLNVTTNGTYYPDGKTFREVNVNVPSTTISPLSVTANGTYTAPSGTAYNPVTVNVPTGSTINNQNKTVTPTKSQQNITFDVDSNNYTGLGTVTVNAIPAEYITTNDADAIAANILLNKTAYVNGSKITGSMANNGATGGTITTQGGTYTIPAGYTSGGIVTANIAASTITNTALNVASFEETTGDYGVRASITIPAGYYNQTTLTKDLSTVLPAPDTAIAENQMLAGYQAYNNEGELLTGTMTNNAAWSRTLDQTTTSVTIPAGYHNGTGTVSHTTVNIPDPTISVSSGGLITASGNWTRGFTTDNSYSKTQQLTTQAAKTVTPTESEQNAVAAGVYTTGIVKVGAISSTYVGSGVTKKAAATITPGTSNQTIAAGTYLTGAQTIAGDTDLVASNIISTANIFGVQGSVVINKYYTGSATPSSSLGNNGDIYFQS